MPFTSTGFHAFHCLEGTQSLDSAWCLCQQGCGSGGGGGGVLLGFFVGAVLPSSRNPNPISDRNVIFSRTPSKN